MSDDLNFDRYLSHSMMNWSAAHRAPCDGRARLLRAVVSPPHKKDHWYTRLLQTLGPGGFTYQQALVLEDGYYFRPAPQSQLWYAQFSSSSWRFSY